MACDRETSELIIGSKQWDLNTRTNNWKQFKNKEQGNKQFALPKHAQFRGDFAGESLNFFTPITSGERGQHIALESANDALKVAEFFPVVVRRGNIIILFEFHGRFLPSPSSIQSQRSSGVEQLSCATPNGNVGLWIANSIGLISAVSNKRDGACGVPVPKNKCGNFGAQPKIKRWSPTPKSAPCLCNFNACQQGWIFHVVFVLLCFVVEFTSLKMEMQDTFQLGNLNVILINPFWVGLGLLERLGKCS